MHRLSSKQITLIFFFFQWSSDASFEFEAEHIGFLFLFSGVLTHQYRSKQNTLGFSFLFFFGGFHGLLCTRSNPLSLLLWLSRSCSAKLIFVNLAAWVLCNIQSRGRA
jgi:hypothetical protein